MNVSAQQRVQNTTAMNINCLRSRGQLAADKKAIGSVIVNAASSNRFFEPALPRNYTLGVQASLPF
jgi:hypothetical protein